MTRPVALVFLKYPAPGRVKTRLAAAVGPERAAELYREMLDAVLAAVQPLRDRADVIGYFDGAAADAFAGWHSLADDWLPQPAGGLGERLEAGFALAHARGGPVLAVGTDSPEIDAALLGEAIELLQTTDAVFGPAHDGGYYLVGTARHLPGFFDGVRWSSEHTLADHLDRCRAAGWSAARLRPLHDIDTADDWLAYQQRTSRGGHQSTTDPSSSS